MSTQTIVANLALQKVGAGRISALTENSKPAREVNAVYDTIRQAMLREKRWKFSITRRTLTEDSTAPAFGKTTRFRLPNDYLRILPPYPEDRVIPHDWIIEGGGTGEDTGLFIYTNDETSINVRYIRDITNEGVMDPLFRLAFALRIAVQILSKFKPSNTTARSLQQEYKDAMATAAQTDAIEKLPQEPAEDPWITSREDGRDYSRGWGG